MFFVELTYKKELSEIDKFGSEHIAFLERKIQDGAIIVSGRKNPRSGGVFLVNFDSREQVDVLIAEDCFYRENLADYHIIDFTPVKFDKRFADFIGTKKS